MVVQSQKAWIPSTFHEQETRSVGRRVAIWYGLLLALAMATTARAQMQVGDDVLLNLNGQINAGYSASYGDLIPSSHGLEAGGSAQLGGSYYSPNFLSFTATPYYNQSRADSQFQSLTDASGIDETTNFFSGSKYPGFANFHYAHNSTGTLGLVNYSEFHHGRGQHGVRDWMEPTGTELADVLDQLLPRRRRWHGLWNEREDEWRLPKH